MNGSEWVVEAYGCDPARLGDTRALIQLFNALVNELALNPIGDARWHVFPPPGGVTGLLMLAESHVTLHTFPEHASMCMNLFCCRPRAEWDWAKRLEALVGARDVRVRRLIRAFAPSDGSRDADDSRASPRLLSPVTRLVSQP